MSMIQVADQMPSLRGHYDCKVYLGEIERAPLSKTEIEENWHEMWAAAAMDELPRHLHQGEVINAQVDHFGGDNLIVTVGKALMMDRLYGLSGVGAMSRMGVGTSATAAAVGNTSLTGAVFKAFDLTPTRSSLTVTSQTTFGTGDANINWQELGQDNGTTLLSRIAPIGPFNKTSAVSIIVQYALTQN